MATSARTGHVVCLTFDFDAISTWISRGMVTPTPISRGEFGVVGAQRILQLLKRYEIASTWFIPGHTLDTYPEMCARVHAEGHEIANHGYLHERPTAVSAEQEEAALVKGSDAIRRVTGASPSGYRSPGWDLSPHTIDLLIRHGFLYDSSMMAHDHQPYRARRGDTVAVDALLEFGETTDLIEMPVSWSLSDYQHFEFVNGPPFVTPGLRRSSDVLDNWVDDVRYLIQTTACGVLTYTFHPQAIGRGHRMLFLDRLVQALSALGARFARLDAVARKVASTTD
ncbi:MAG TPA: polysaccharide deacetylase [bacterium]|nr:polysaccharide deacetylase [bacterium]